LNKMRQFFFWSIAIIFAFCSITNARGSRVETEKVMLEGVYFFGYEGFNVNNLRQAFSLKKGAIVDLNEWFPNRMNTLKAEIKNITGAEATDMALINTGDGPIVFVGVPGKSNSKPSARNAIGTTAILAPNEIKKAYDRMTELLPKAVARKTKEDVEQFNAAKIELKTLSEVKRPELLAALDSSDSTDRVVASFALGLVADKPDELAALVRLANDPDSVVRNNSTRELGELLQDHPELVKYIPAAPFIAMLNSPTWTDRNKSIFVLDKLTRSRSPAVLKELCDKALPSLKEMCDWPSGYAETAIELLGRIAGIPDEKLLPMCEKKDPHEVLRALDSALEKSPQHSSKTEAEKR